jgi:hypothetical protein
MIFDPRPLFSLPEGVHTRWASPENPQAKVGAAAQSQGGRKGSSNVPVPAGAQLVLAEVSGTSGVIRRIWATISDRTPAALRGLRIDIYWDGAATPGVSAPFGDFFGQGLGRCQKFESVFFSNPEGRSFNCCLPMPFRSAFKMVLTNESGLDIAMLFYDVDFTVGDRLDETALYLHAHWRRENPTRLQQDYEFLPKITGRGRYLGVNVTEDYIGTAWGQGQYSHLYQGCHLADEENWQYAFYRYHVPDPVFFHRDIRITMHQIGCWDPKSMQQFVETGRRLIVNGPGQVPVDMKAALEKQGYGLYERQDDWSSCCYFYLDRTENGLLPLADANSRMKDLLSPQPQQKTAGLM